jgi:mannosyltransferase OCH1-like enzyme
MKIYDRWDKDIFIQEGLDKNSFHDNWAKNHEQALEALDKKIDELNLKVSSYKIPPITHVVYFTSLQNPNPWKELYVNKYLKTNERINAEDSKFTHYIWSNKKESIPSEIRSLPKVQVRELNEFSDHPLMPNLQKFLDEGQSDPRIFVEASDVARIMTQQKYGGVYHDLDYEVFDAKTLIRYMKSLTFFAGKEEKGRWDSFIGNAFFASKVNHPVINKLAKIIKRNLDLVDAPDYIRV